MAPTSKKWLLVIDNGTTAAIDVSVYDNEADAQKDYEAEGDTGYNVFLAKVVKRKGNRR